jgi:hypothetical protein
MNLYLDDDSAKTILIALLRKAGHQVVIPTDVGLRGADDAEHFLHAVKTALFSWTRNHEDYDILHRLVQAAAGPRLGKDSGHRGPMAGPYASSRFLIALRPRGCYREIREE